MGVHHVGVAVEDLDEAISSYERLFGGELAGRQTQDEQGVEAASLLVGNGHVELLSPLAPDTPLGRFLAKRGPGMHHVAYDATPRRGLFGTQVAFVHPESVHGVLSELVARG